MGWIKPVLLLPALSLAQKYCTMKKLKRFLPIASWLPNYKLSFIKNDLIAGLTVGLTLVPQALAFAQVANIPPEYGLYSSFMGLYVYTLFGTSKDAALGPTNLLSMLVGQIMLGLHSQNPIYTSLMSLLGGLTLLLMGFLRLGFLVNMFSIPVISGFTSAAGLIIIINQLGNLFGINIAGVTPFEQVANFCYNFTKMNFADLITGGLGLVFLLVMQRMPNFTSRRFSNFRRGSRLAEFMRVLCACRNVILVVTATIFSFVMTKMHSELGLTLIGRLPTGLPVPHLPSFSITNETRFGNVTSQVVVIRTTSQIIFEDLGMSLVVVPLMTMLELFAITKALGRKNHYKVDHSQELVAVGLANVAGSFFHAFPISAAVTRSALNDQCHVATPLAGSLSAVVVIIACLFAMPIFYFIPKSILAAIIMSAGISLIDLATVAHVSHEWKWDLIPLAATFIVSLFAHMWQGILVGVSISLAMLLAPVVRLKIVTEHLTSTPGGGKQQPSQPIKDGDFVTPNKQTTSATRKPAEPTPFQTPISISDQNQSQNAQQATAVQRIVIVRLQQGLQYPSVDRFTDRMSKIIAKDVGQIVIDCQFITGLDFTALQGIRHVLLLAYRLNRSVVFARLSDHLRKRIELLDIDHFRHVSRWDDLVDEEEEGGVEGGDLEWNATRLSLNGSAFGDTSVDAILAKRTTVGKTNVEDLTPIPEEQSEQSIEAVITIPNGSPLPKPGQVSVPRPRSDHALNAAGQLAYEPHFFGSAIPLAVGSVSLEDVTKLAFKDNHQFGRNLEPVENFIRGSRHMAYVVSDVEDGTDSENDSDSENGINVMNHVAGSAMRHHRLHRNSYPVEHVELLEFTRKPSKRGHAASGEVCERSGTESFEQSFRTPGSQTKPQGGLVATASYPYLKTEGDGTAKGGSDAWPADALVSNLARSLSHQNNSQNNEEGLQMVSFSASASKKSPTTGEKDTARSPKITGASPVEKAAGTASPTVVIVHSSTSEEATVRDKMD